VTRETQFFTDAGDRDRPTDSEETNPFKGENLGRKRRQKREGTGCHHVGDWRLKKQRGGGGRFRSTGEKEKQATTLETKRRSRVVSREERDILIAESVSGYQGPHLMAPNPC